MVWAKLVQSPAQGGGSRIALQWLHYTKNPAVHFNHTEGNTICEATQCEFDNVVRTHYTPTGLGKVGIWGSPPSNENQTMFKGTIKIFPQRFIYLAEGGPNKTSSMDTI